MSGSKRNFIIGISFILAVILLVGCLPDKQGGFTCICLPVISKIRSLLPGQKTTPADVSPGQVPSTPPSVAQNSALNAWKEQPDLKQEEASLNKRIHGLSSALAANNVEEALSYFQTEQRETYRKLLSSQSPASMKKMASDLNNAKISFLSTEGTQLNRVAEYSISVDGLTFYIGFIKVDGQWMLRNF